MREREPVASKIAQGRVARSAGRGLNTLGVRALDLHVEDFERNAKARADRFAVRRPRVGRSLQAVMHVRRAQHEAALRREPGEQMQQNGGIESAGETDGKDVVRFDEAGQRCADPLDEIRRRPAP